MFLYKLEVEREMRGELSLFMLCSRRGSNFFCAGQFLINKDFSFPIFFVPLHPNLNHAEKYKRK